MDKEQFVTIVDKFVHKSNVEGMKFILSNPPGRGPNPKLNKLSKWFDALSEKDKEKVYEIIEITSHGCVFSFLCILDEVRKIEEGENVGRLKLYYEKGNSSTIINDDKGDFLHDLFNSVCNIL